MRDIAEIIEDDKNGKRLSQTESQIACAYFQGKYDAAMELKVGNNSNTNEVIDKIRAEIEEVYLNTTYKENQASYKVGGSWGLRKALEIIDKYKAESEK